MVVVISQRLIEVPNSLFLQNILLWVKQTSRHDQVVYIKNHAILNLDGDTNEPKTTHKSLWPHSVRGGAVSSHKTQNNNMSPQGGLT